MLWYILYLIFIIDLKNLYRLNFKKIDFPGVRENLEKLLYNLDLEHNYQDNDIVENIKFCLESDYEKLFHNDIIMDDAYIYREKMDSIQLTAQINYFDSCFFKQIQVQYSREIKYIQFQTQNEFILSQNQSFCLNLIPKWITLNYSTKSENQTQLDDKRRFWCLFKQDIVQNANLTLFNKYNVANSQLELYYKAKQKNIRNQCLNDLQYQSLSYKQNLKNDYNSAENFKSLTNESQCQKILKILGDEENETDIKYLLKQSKHKGQGVRIMSIDVKQDILNQFDYGKKCGQLNSSEIVQTYLTNTLQYQVQQQKQQKNKKKGYKVEFRFYILIVQTSPMIVYFYDNPLAYRCIQKYYLNNIESNLCNPYISRKFWDIRNQYMERTGLPVYDVYNDTLQGEDTFVFKTLQEWSQYFYKNSSQEWIKHISSTIATKISYLLTLNYKSIVNDPRVSSILAVDTLIDYNSDIRIIDINTAPATRIRYPKQEEYQINMHKKIIKILMTFVRQRYQRIQNFIVAQKYNNQSIHSQNITQLYYHPTPNQMMLKLFDFTYIDIQKSMESCLKQNIFDD